jgi:outer membrane protein assembly factor BamB
MIDPGRLRLPSAAFALGVLAALSAFGGWAVSLAADAPPSGQTKPDATEQPWDFSGPERPFAETCFDDFQTTGGGLSARTARRWLADVPGRPLEIAETAAEPAGRAVTLKGFARLRAPWMPGAVLRLSLTANQPPLKLHFWSGREGVVFFCYRIDNRPVWAVYRTTRHPVEPLVIAGQPHQVIDPGLALLATDDQRAGRTVDGTVEIRYQQRALVMTKGDVRLMTAPLEGPPAEVYFDCPALFLRDLAMYHGQPAPDDPPCLRRVILRGERPGLLPWQESLVPESELVRRDDGSVALVAGPTAEPAWATVPLMRPGLYEIVFEVEEAAPGTGLLLADRQGRPVQGIEFARDLRTGLVAMGYGAPMSAPAAPAVNVEAAPAPLAGPRQWVRLVLAAGVLRCWTSGDGQHWGQMLPPLVQPGGVARVGLFCRPGDQRRGIRLRTLCVRELDGLTSLVPPAVLERAESLGVFPLVDDPADFGAWQQRVWETLPAGLEAATWRSACALATLIGGAEPRLGKALLGELVREAIEGPLSPAASLRLLEDAALAMDISGAEDAARFAALCERFRRTAICEDGPPEPAEVQRALLAMPLWTSGGVRFEPLGEQAARDELLALASRGRWNDVDRLCRQLRLWNQPPELWTNWPSPQDQLRPLVDWLDLQAARALGRKVRSPLSSESVAWERPLAVTLDKDAYTTLSELRSAVANQFYADAARILASVRRPTESILLADPADGQRSLSVAATVEEIVRESPPLVEAIGAGLAAGGRLRVQEVLAEGDEEAVKTLTLRYCGTPTAAVAHAWLADRLVAAGRFAQAIAEYHRALRAADPNQRAQLAARIRLAEAMLGRNAGNPPTTPVQLGPVGLAPADFERMVAEMIREHGGLSQFSRNEIGTVPLSPDPTGAPDGTPPHAPGPVALEAIPLAALRGPAGAKAAEVPGPSRLIDWPARQTAVTLAGGRMIVSNRFQVTALDPADGTVKWTWAEPEPQGPAHAWPLVPMRPCPAGSRVYVRLIAPDGRPQIVCLDAPSGKPLWRTRLAALVISDPLPLRDQLFALVTDLSEEQSPASLDLAAIDPATGALLGRRTLVDLRREWFQHRVCQAVVAGEKIVAAVGGAVLCCDPFEGVDWVRQGPWVPAPLDPGAARQWHQPPLVAGGRLYVAQPGARVVQCIELAAGRLVWQRTVPGVEQAAFLAGPRLLVETDRQVLALDAATGQVSWQHDAPERLCGCMTAADGLLVYVRRKPLGPGDFCPVLVWCDLGSGRAVARRPLVGLRGKQPLVGPLVAHGGRTWAFVGVSDAQSSPQPARDLVELAASGPALPDERFLSAWNPAADARLQTAAAAVLPGWTVYSSAGDEKTGLAAPAASLPEVLVTKAAEAPVRLIRRVDVPAGGHPHLLMEVGHDASASSRIDVLADGLPLVQGTLKPAGPANPWRRAQIDLSAFAGRSVWVAVLQHRDSGAAAYAWWKRLEVIPEKLPPLEKPAAAEKEAPK